MYIYLYKTKKDEIGLIKYKLLEKPQLLNYLAIFPFTKKYNYEDQKLNFYSENSFSFINNCKQSEYKKKKCKDKRDDKSELSL